MSPGRWIVLINLLQLLAGSAALGSKPRYPEPSDRYALLEDGSVEESVPSSP